MGFWEVHLAHWLPFPKPKVTIPNSCFSQSQKSLLAGLIAQPISNITDWFACVNYCATIK